MRTAHILAARAMPVRDIIGDWLGDLGWKRSAHVSVNVDPYSFR